MVDRDSGESSVVTFACCLFGFNLAIQSAVVSSDFVVVVGVLVVAALRVYCS